jgi:hypothetical protein
MKTNAFEGATSFKGVSWYQGQAMAGLPNVQTARLPAKTGRQQRPFSGRQ